MTRNSFQNAIQFIIRFSGASLLSVAAVASALPAEFGVALGAALPLA